MKFIELNIRLESRIFIRYMFYIIIIFLFFFEFECVIDYRGCSVNIRN